AQGDAGTDARLRYPVPVDLHVLLARSSPDWLARCAYGPGTILFDGGLLAQQVGVSALWRELGRDLLQRADDRRVLVDAGSFGEPGSAADDTLQYRRGCCTVRQFLSSLRQCLSLRRLIRCSKIGWALPYEGLHALSELRSRRPFQECEPLGLQLLRESPAHRTTQQGLAAAIGVNRSGRETSGQ